MDLNMNHFWLKMVIFLLELVHHLKLSRPLNFQEDYSYPKYSNFLSDADYLYPNLKKLYRLLYMLSIPCQLSSMKQHHGHSHHPQILILDLKQLLSRHDRAGNTPLDQSHEFYLNQHLDLDID